MKVRRQMLRQILSPSVARGVAVLCTAVFVASTPSSAPAAGVVGTGTAASCTDAALDAALAGGGWVTFDCGGPATIDIGATKWVTVDTIIDGGGEITLSASHRVGVFVVNSGVKFTVDNVTIADGAADSGGGIANAGTLTVINSTFTDNFADRHGGGIVNTADAVVSNCTFTRNDAIGGGIYSINPGSSLTVTNSTFTDNPGGGIVNFNYAGMTVTNSTFTGNAFGIRSDGNVDGNSVLRNTIVAGSTSGENCIGPITDGGHNLDDGTSCGFSATNGSQSNANPQLDPAGLRNNGGPTQTVALCMGPDEPAGCREASPAIDAGDPAVCAAAPVHHLDQRGLYRPDGCPNCSIGAYEPGATTPICEGDCDGNRRVTVDELIEGVNIALGVAPLIDCLPFLCQSDPNVLVACVVQAVNAALNGVCIARPQPQFEGGPGCK